MSDQDTEKPKALFGEIKTQVIVGIIVTVVLGFMTFIVSDYMSLHGRVSDLESFVETSLPGEPSQVVLNQYLETKIEKLEEDLNSLIANEGVDDAEKQFQIIGLLQDINYIKGRLGL